MKKKMPQWKGENKGIDNPYAGIYEHNQEQVIIGIKNCMGWDYITVKDTKKLIKVLEKSIQFIEKRKKCQ